jgi:hypothetical protein
LRTAARVVGFVRSRALNQLLPDLRDERSGEHSTNQNRITKMFRLARGSGSTCSTCSHAVCHAAACTQFATLANLFSFRSHCRNGKEAHPSAAYMSVVGAAVQADSAATAQDPRHAGRPAGDGDQDEAQRRQVPGLSGNRRPEGEGQAQARLCPWVRLLQTRRASDLHGTLCFYL